MAGRFVLGDKEGPARERCYQNLSARSRGRTVVVVMCMVVSKMYTRDGTVVSEMHGRELVCVT